MRLVTGDVWVVRITGDTDQVFIGDSLATAQTVAQAWIESEQVRGYLASNVTLPKITGWLNELGQFFYSYTCDDCGEDNCGEKLGEHEGSDGFTYKLLTAVSAD
jgi:hypothetical protein